MEDVKTDLFNIGATYQLSTSLASLLICEGYAVPVDGVFGRRQTSTQSAASDAPDRRGERRGERRD